MGRGGGGGYQPPNSYHVPPRNIITEGDRFVTFEQRPDCGISNLNNRNGRGGSSYGLDQPTGAFKQFKRPEQTPVYDPRAYKDVHYDQDAELEKLWKHISANNSGGSKPKAMTFTSKPPKFDGRDWEGYILQFNSCAVANDWDDEQSVKYLASSLTGDAVYVLAQKPVRSWSFSELCYALEERYGLTNSAFVNRSKLRRISQQKGQSIQQVADYFIDAIQDPELKRHLMQKEPGDIRSAVVIAKKFEEIQLATLPRVPRVFNAQETGNMGQGNEENNHIRELHEEITRLRLRQADLENKLSLSEARGQRNMADNFQRGQNYGQGGRGYRQNTQGGPVGAENPNWRRQGGQG